MGADAAAEEQFGPYAVYERLGVGGMATVHRALERGPDGFERMVALKRLLPHLADDASFIKSFVREAKLASILNHINIVQIYELGRVGAEYFISMEYIDGRDVRRILRHARKVTGPPPIHVTVALLIQLCEALDYAHAKADEDGQPLKLVHRDVSPSNVIVTSSGHLKVIDFGIAKAESSQLRTQTGRVKGKLAYMAPEAIAGGRDLDARSDLWAVGVILHELLTARPLFASKNEYQTLLKVQKGDILPPSTFNQGCPPELDAIVFKALARDPDDRFATAGEMRDALLEVKKQYSLQTGYRDVSAWLDWAFSLEQPGNFTNQPTTGVSEVDPVSKQVRAKTPRPARNREEDEAVEMVWGAEGEAPNTGPVLLDDVPDVSLQPTHLDSELVLVEHGAPHDMPPPQALFDAVDAALARGTDPPMARGSAEMRSTATGSQPKARPTGPQAVAPEAIAVRPTGPQRAQRATGSISVPKPAGTQRTTGSVPVPRTQTGSVPVPRTQTGSVPVPRTPTGAVPTEPQRQPPRTTAQGIPGQRGSSRMPAQPAQRQSDRVPVQPAARQSDRVPVQRTSAAQTAVEIPHSEDTAESLSLSDTNQALRAEDLFAGDDDDNNLAAADNAATMTQLPKRRETEFEVTTNPAALPMEPELPAVPVVRFSKTASTTDPPATRPTPTTMLPAAVGAQTKQGLPPVAMPKRVTTSPPLNQLQPTRTKSASQGMVGPAIVKRGNARLWIAIGIGVVVAGGAGTGMLLMSNPRTDAKAHVAPAAATATTAPVVTTGSVKLITEPADAEITIEGMPAHTGAPWTVDLPAGIHQVEIRRQGYKAWLTSLELSARETQTLRVVLEPLGAAAAADASLAISTNPPGLEATLDGQPLVEHTPTKTTVKVGPHTIAVKQNGVEVWHQTFKAEASSDYEFNPSFTADKKALRATSPAAPAPKKIEEVKAEPLEPAGSAAPQAPGSATTTP
jgi:serine/threonine protein kinase